MPDDRFEDRLRALARQLSRSISDADLDEVADRLGFDRDRIHGAAGAAEAWLTDRGSTSEPLFAPTPSDIRPAPRATLGPHPLDVPSEEQGRALSALASGRWTLRPGSGALSSSGDGPPPPEHADLTGELSARDWITADGTVTIVGRQALLRWCRTADGHDGDEAVEPGDSDVGA
jgi:hypothetical protein